MKHPMRNVENINYFSVLSGKKKMGDALWFGRIQILGFSSPRSSSSSLAQLSHLTERSFSGWLSPLSLVRHCQLPDILCDLFLHSASLLSIILPLPPLSVCPFLSVIRWYKDCTGANRIGMMSVGHAPRLGSYPTKRSRGSNSGTQFRDYG